MLPFFRRFRVGFTLVPLFVAALCLWASALVRQETGGGTEMHGGVTTAPEFPSDFEVKIAHGEFLVRQKGSQKWKPSSKLKEPIAVGMLDGNHKIYVSTKAIEPPKPKHTEEPAFPHDEQKSGNGRVSMHVVINEQGAVRSPTVCTN